MSARPSRDSAHAPATAEEAYPPIGYAWYVVSILTVIYIFSFIDRVILSLLVQPIRRDLGISDTRMSLLMGFSFAVFYSFFGIPLGRLADSRSRRTLIAIGCAVWSLMTAWCGLARNYLQLLLLRMGVGVGEATLSPAAYSLITDYFPKQRLATAMSVYSTAIHLGSGLAYILGGLVVGFIASQGESINTGLPIVGAIRPWQIVFFIVGLPGLVLALLMYTVKEPVRRDLRPTQFEDGRSQASQASLGEVFRYFAENKATLICHNVGFALSTLTSYT
ncbi:MAG: MFS transporter, partial [Blastocatellia bacterium]